MMTSSSIVAKTLARRCRVAAVARPLLASAHTTHTTHTTSTSRFLSDDTRNNNNGSNSNSNSNSKTDHLIPGTAFHQSAYGSLGDASSSNILASNNISEGVGANSNDFDGINSDNAAAALCYELTRTTAATIESVVPWFLKTMPVSYFQQIPPYLRRDHVKALAAVIDADMDIYLNLKGKTSDGRTVYTYIRPTTQPGTLLNMVEELPRCDPSTPSLTRLHVFSAHDDSFSLNMFVYGDSMSQEDEEREREREPTPYRDIILQFAEEVRQGNKLTKYPDLDPNEACFEESNLKAYLSKCRDNYLKIICEHPERFLRQRMLFESVSGTECCEARIEEAVHEELLASNNSSSGGKQYWLDVAMANSLPQVALEHTCRLLYVQGFDVGRARLDVIPDGDNGSVTMLRLLIHPADQNDNAALGNVKFDTHVVGNGTQTKFERLQSNLKRMKWLDDTTMKLVFDDEPWLGVKRGEIITAMCNLLHPILLNKTSNKDAKNNAYGGNSHFYSKHNILVRFILSYISTFRVLIILSTHKTLKPALTILFLP
jgi:hypothetical protein